MKFRKTKKEFLITTKVDFSIQIVYVLLKIFCIMLIFFEKNAYGGCIKAKYVLSEIRMLNLETELQQRLEDLA